MGITRGHLIHNIITIPAAADSSFYKLQTYLNVGRYMSRHTKQSQHINELICPSILNDQY